MLIHHGAFVDDDELGLGHWTLAIQGKCRSNAGLASGLILDRLFTARSVDQRMQCTSIGGAFGPKHLGCLASKSRELDVTLDMLGEIAGKCRLAGTGITEKPKNRAASVFQPF